MKVRMELLQYVFLFFVFFIAVQVRAVTIQTVTADTGADTLEVLFTTDQLATSTVFYGTSTAYGFSTTSDIATTSADYLITGLTPNTMYFFKIRADNSIGHVITSTDYSVMTAASAVPKFSTAILPTASNITQTSVTLNANVETDNYSSTTVRGFYYGTSTAYTDYVVDTNGPFPIGSFSFPVTGLATSTQYYFQAFLVNGSGMSSTTNYTFTTASEVIEAPVVQQRRLALPSSTHFGCKDPKATNYEYFAESKPSLCTYVATVPSAQFMFTKTLSLGSVGNEVLMLQKKLNNLGFVISQNGAGSIGNETTTFGAKTMIAVKAYQKANGIPMTGMVGPLTRASLNK